MKDVDFNSQFSSNEKHLFSKILSPEKYGKAFLVKKGYQYSLVVSFTAPPPAITTSTQTGEQTSSTS